MKATRAGSVCICQPLGDRAAPCSEVNGDVPMWVWGGGGTPLSHCSRSRPNPLHLLDSAVGWPWIGRHRCRRCSTYSAPRATSPTVGADRRYCTYRWCAKCTGQRVDDSGFRRLGIFHFPGPAAAGHLFCLLPSPFSLLVVTRPSAFTLCRPSLCALHSPMARHGPIRLPAVNLSPTQHLLSQ